MNCLHRLVWFGKNTESVFVMNSYLTIMDISDDKAVDFQLAYFIFSAISLCKKKGARLPIFTFFAVYKAPALIALFSRCYCQLFGSLDVCLSPQFSPPLHLFWLTLFGFIWFGFYRLSHGSLVGQFVIGLFLHICHNARPFIKNPSLPYGFGSLFMLAPHFIVACASKNHLFLHKTDDNV